MRTIIEIPDEAIEELARICKRLNISRTEAVRQAVATFIQEKGEAEEDDVFGMWKSKRVDGRKYEDSIRGEWR